MPAWTPAHRLGPRPGAEYAALSELVEQDVDDIASMLDVLAMTDPRARDAAGAFLAYPLAEQYRGSSAAAVMMPFLFPSSSRFSAGLHGVLYGADDIDTAIAEVSHHHARRLLATYAPAGTMILLAQWSFTLAHDLEDIRSHPAALFDPVSYSASQAFGLTAKRRGSSGVLYPSVRRPGNECVGVLRPVAVESMEKADDWRLIWDGKTITEALVAK